MTTLRVESRQFSAAAPAFNLPRLRLAPPLGVTPFEFCRNFRRQKTRLPGLSCGVVCVFVEHRLVTDGQTDTRRRIIPALASVARVTIAVVGGISQAAIHADSLLPIISGKLEAV